LRHLRLPASARVDSGVRNGDRITPDYDPMIAKIITHGPDRAIALARMRVALAETEAAGVSTNLGLLAAIAANPHFAAADLDTGFIARHATALMPHVTLPDAAIAAAAVAVLRARAAAAMVPGDPYSPWAASDSWRLNLLGAQAVALRHGEAALHVQAQALADGGWALDWGAGRHEVAVASRPEGRWALRMDAATHAVTVLAERDSVLVITAGRNHLFEIVDPLQPPRAAAAGGGRVIAPIPGRVASVAVKPGDKVARGQVLVVLEAMKMEISLSASLDGTVAALRCTVGEMVEEGVELVEIQPEEDA
jgi:3-methylcrotonyl-CoA carboxylase alpha subunit